MNYQQVINEYIEFLWKMFQYDMSVFSQGWMYWLLLIPAGFYFVFFILKWVVLTVPLWMPLVIIVNTFGSAIRKSK